MSALVRAIRRIASLRRTAPDRDFARDRVVWLGPKIAGVWVTPDEALRIPAAWACVSVISKALASSRIDIYAEGPDGNRESLPASFGISRLLNLRPNPEMTAFAFREAAYIVALVYGNFYAEIERDAAGRPVALWPLAPNRCQLVREEKTRRLVLEVQNAERGPTVLDYDDVFHLHGPGIDGLCGFDTVTMAARSLAYLAAMERFGLAFYENGTQFGGILTSDSPNLSDAKVKDLREQLEARHKGPQKAFRFLLLSGGLKWESNVVEPEAAQSIETKTQLIQDICRWFGVPPHKIAEMSRSTFANIEHQGLEFVRDALTPWAERFSQEADWKLILSNSVGTRIDLEWLAEGDAKSKADTDSILVRNGLLSRNEARKRRGLNNLGPDGDVLTVEGQLIPLDQVGERPPAAASAPEEPPPETPPAPNEREAARAIFAGTMKRAYERLAERRAEPNAMRDHAHHVGTKIGDAVAVLERVGVRFDDTELKAALAAHIETDAALAEIDGAARAAIVADSLAALIRKG